MIVELTLSHMIFLIAAGISAAWTMMKIIAAQNQRFFTQTFTSHEKAEFAFHEQLNKRLDGIEAANRAEASQWQRVERELLTLKADLPVNYVRREDYIRGQSVLEAKLDGLGGKLENAQLRALRDK